MSVFNIVRFVDVFDMVEVTVLKILLKIAPKCPFGAREKCPI